MLSSRVTSEGKPSEITHESKIDYRKDNNMNTDTRVENYREFFTKNYLMGPNSLRLLDEMLRKSPLKEGGRVMDLGCGMGITSLFLWVLALYVPLDWFFRDVQPIGFLGSVWDELLLIAAFAWVLWMRVDHKVALPARAMPAAVTCDMIAGRVLMVSRKMVLPGPAAQDELK